MCSGGGCVRGLFEGGGVRRLCVSVVWGGEGRGLCVCV